MTKTLRDAGIMVSIVLTVGAIALIGKQLTQAMTNPAVVEQVAKYDWLISLTLGVLACGTYYAIIRDPWVVIIPIGPVMATYTIIHLGCAFLLLDFMWLETSKYTPNPTPLVFGFVVLQVMTFGPAAILYLRAKRHHTPSTSVLP